VNVVLNVVLCHVEAGIDQLEIDFLEKLLCLWLFPDLKAERDVRRLQNIAPEAAHSDVLMLFFMVAGNVA